MLTKYIIRGREEGEVRRAEKIALKMLIDQLPIDVIKKFTDLPEARIIEIAKNNHLL